MHEVQPVEGAAVTRDLESLRAWAESHNADFFMLGRLAKGGAGRLICALSLFDRAKGRISIAEVMPEVLPLDLFDASDELIALVLNEATGRHIGFSRIAFKPSGENGAWRAILDGREAGGGRAGSRTPGPGRRRLPHRKAAGECSHAISTSAFHMGRYEVTQVEWFAFMGTRPSFFPSDLQPVEQVNWYECLVFCNRRSLKEGLTPCSTIGGKADPDGWGAVPDSMDGDWDSVRCDFAAGGYRLSK